VTAFSVTALPGVGEVLPGTDLAEVIGGSDRTVERGLLDGDVLVVTSKVVSKAEGRVRRGTRDEFLHEETDRVVARRGPTTIVRTRHGLVMAAAGIDASNTEPGTVVLLPEDPDHSARGLRERLLVSVGANVAVVLSDTSGRAWRNGQTDIAVGCAGLRPLEDHSGRVDGYGNRLEVTAPATADEVAAAADLAKGKLSGRPVALLRGLAGLVLPPGEHGPGAGALVRAEAGDLFGYGAREAVLHAVLADDEGRGFGAPAPPTTVAEALRRVVGGRGTVTVVGETVETLLVVPDPREAGRTEAAVDAVARAHGWLSDPRAEDTAGTPAGGPRARALSAFRPRRP